MTESPCVKICKMQSNSKCSGCGRTLDEIKSWSTLSDVDKQKINTRVLVEKWWPDLELPPINLWKVVPAKWLVQQNVTTP